MPERIRVQVADGVWETLGVDRHQGIYPEGIAPTWDAGGPAGMAFNLKRSPDEVLVDLEEFTPIEYLPDGERVTWSGFTIETPGSPDDQTVAVNALGWQFHAEDDPVKALYVHEDLSVWQDIRQRLEADLTRVGTAAGVAQADGGGIVIGWPKGVDLGGSAPYAGVIFDAGEEPDYWPAAIAVDYVKNTLVGGWGRLIVRNSDSPNIAVDATDYEDVISRATTEANGVYPNVAATFTTKRRYVAVIAFYDGAGFSGTGEDDLWTLTGIRLAGKAAYLAGGVSILKASDVIADAYARVPLLSKDTSLIAPTTLALRHFTATDESPRAIGDRVNGYHVHRLKVDHLRRVVFQPQSDRPVLAVDLAKPGARWRDASVNNGRSIYNKVLVRGRTGSGVELRIVRYSAHLWPTRSVALVSPAPTNPGFEVNSAGWVKVSRSISKTRTGSGCGEVLLGAGLVNTSQAGEASFTGSDFIAGFTYRFDVFVAIEGPSSASGNRLFAELVAGVPGATNDVALAVTQLPGLDTYGLASVLWWPRTTYPAASVKLQVRGFRSLEDRSSITSVRVDDLAVSRIVATSPDRRGFARTYTLDVQAPTDLEGMAALGDAFLRLHAYTPLAGDVEITADGAVTRVGSEDPVPLGDLGIYTGELILLRNLIDPDTGDLGRVGIIKTVGKSGDRATIALDNERANFQGLLARMGAVGAR
jgi:hypothetical protein